MNTRSTLAPKIATLIISVALLFAACNPSNNKSDIAAGNYEQIDGFTIYADTIVYDILIKNPNPEDRWATACLKNLKRSSFVDSIFEIAYSGDVLVTDYFTNDEISPSQLRKLEKRPERGRNAIGKIQFTERWLLNAENGVFKKDVLQIVLGYEIISTNTGEVRGYEPAFRIELNTHP